MTTICLIIVSVDILSIKCFGEFGNISMWRIFQPEGIKSLLFPMNPWVELVAEDSSAQTEEERLDRFGLNEHKSFRNEDGSIYCGGRLQGV